MPDSDPIVLIFQHITYCYAFSCLITLCRDPNKLDFILNYFVFCEVKTVFALERQCYLRISDRVAFPFEFVPSEKLVRYLDTHA